MMFWSLTDFNRPTKPDAPAFGVYVLATTIISSLPINKYMFKMFGSSAGII